MTHLPEDRRYQNHPSFIPPELLTRYLAPAETVHKYVNLCDITTGYLSIFDKIQNLYHILHQHKISFTDLLSSILVSFNICTFNRIIKIASYIVQSPLCSVP